MCKLRLYILFCVFVKINCFNLDTVNYVKQSGDPGSMFGFSVATHSDRGSTWTIIGAPNAQTRQPGVIQGGSVYRCPTDRDDACQELPFDRLGNNVNSDGTEIDMKSRQWFGATVNSGGPDKPIVACAPRYVWFSTTFKRRDPVGTCFLSKGDFTDFHEYSPCRTKNWGYHRQGACQAGLSAAVSKDGERLFIGAPGSWYWQGQMYSLDPTVRHPFANRFGEYGATGQAYAQSIKNRPSVLKTKEGVPIDDDSYMGYSLAVGDFTGDGESGAAIGMPRANTREGKLVGKVVLYTWNLTNHQNISGEQLGGYFGYCIAAADIDGDGYDDLIIGAPLYTEANNEGKYEVGRVYVRYQRSTKFKGRFEKLDTRDGINSKGRFGLSVASLGDLDLDGYHDIAVGAPYDGPNERGAVYVYCGSSEGLLKKPSQIIRSEDVSQTSLYTFGFSVAGNNIDLDNNQYPDLVVGSYLSDTAIVFKARAVIKVLASILFSLPGKTINLEEKGCTLRNGEKVTCTEIKSCFHYNGTGVSRGVYLNVQFILDAKNHKDPRMFFANHERQSTVNQTWRLEHNVLNCKSVLVYMKEGIRDKLTPLEAEMRYSLKEEPKESYVHRRSTTSVLPPILDRNVPEVYKDKITIRKNCGSDDVCIPDLRLYTRPNVEKYLLGSNKRLEVDVMVKNEGEDSFESMFYMKMPRGVNFFKIERVDDTGIPVQCSAPSTSTNQTLKCDIGNPLPAERLVHFKVLLDPYHEEGMAPSYDFLMGVNSTNPEENETVDDNMKHLSINIWVETDLSLTGWPLSPDVHYNASHYDVENYTAESEIGPQIVHIYSMRNNGPSLINEATALFLWPEKTLANDDLLYLVEQPETAGPIKCDFAFANPLKVTLDRKKSYLETVGIEGSSASVSYEKESSHVSSSGSVSYGSSSHIETHHEKHKKYDEDKKFEDSGDGSFVHLDRGKEVQKAEESGVGGTVTSGGGKVEKTWTSTWNSSQVEGGPVVTHRWNKTIVTGADGVARETTHSSSSSGQGSGGKKYKVFYTSSRGGGEHESGAQTSGAHFSISGQGASSHLGARGHESSQTSSSSQFGGTQEGMSGHETQETHHTSGSKHFNWDKGTGGAHTTVHREHSSSKQFGQGSGEGGTHSTSSKVYTESSQKQSGGQQEHSGSVHIQSGQTGIQTGEDELDINTDHSGYYRPQSGHRGHGTQTQSGQSSIDTQTSHTGHITSGHQTSQSSHGSQSGQGYESHFESGQRGTAGSQEHSQTFGSEHGGQSGVQRGVHQNGTHKISWTIERQHGQGADNSQGAQGADGIKWYNSFVTEETVNQGIDDYTQEMISHGSSGRHGSQESHQTAHGERQHSHQGGRQESHHSSQGQSAHSQGGRDRSTYGQYNQTGYDASLGLGGAAIGGGFRTTALDLGVLTGTNVDDNLSGHDNKDMDDNYEAQYEYSNEGLQYDPDLGSYEEKNYDKTNGGVSYGTSRTYSTGKQNGERGTKQHGGSSERHYSRTYETHGGSQGGENRRFETHGSEGGSRTYQTDSQSHYETRSSSNFGDNVPTEYSTHTEHRHYQRQKRQADDDDLTIKCNATQCRTLRCVAGPMEKDQEAWVVLRFRVNAQTLKKLGVKDSVELSSMMRARIDKLPYIGTPKDEERSIHNHEVFTTVTPTDTEIKVDVVPLWVVVLSACAGAIILLLLIFLLYKCGFFKRNRPSDAPERQPLNRNGHYNGDEQL